MRRGNRNQTRGTSRARNRLQFRVSPSVFCLLSSVFCLLDFPSFAAAADAAGIVVRPFAGDGVRVSIGETEANDRLLAMAADFRLRP